jgi:hypothetical protein
MPLVHKVHVHCQSSYYHHRVLSQYPLTESNNKIVLTAISDILTWSAISQHPEAGDRYHIYLDSISQIGNQDGFPA